MKKILQMTHELACWFIRFAIAKWIFRNNHIMYCRGTDGSSLTQERKAIGRWNIPPRVFLDLPSNTNSGASFCCTRMPKNWLFCPRIMLFFVSCSVRHGALPPPLLADWSFQDAYHKPEIIAGNMLSGPVHVWMSPSEIDSKRFHESLWD